MDDEVTSAAGAPLNAQALSGRTGYLLIKLGEVTARLADETLGVLGLTGRQFNLLATVDSDSSLSQREIGLLLGLDPNIIGAIIDDLEGHGFITRARSEHDRRRHTLSLTPAGKKTLRLADRAATSAEKQLLNALNDEQARQLHDLATRVLAPHWPVRHAR